MRQPYINAMSLTGPSNSFGGMSPLQGMAQQGMAMGGVQQTNGGAFQSMLVDLAKEVNTTMTQPTEMLREAAANGTYDIHEVMLANSKAELAVNIASQFTTKIVQAYDRILQIQV